jgi:hypothetical protein
MSEKRTITLDWNYENGKVVAPLSVSLDGSRSNIHQLISDILDILLEETGKRHKITIEPEEKV